MGDEVNAANPDLNGAMHSEKDVVESFKKVVTELTQERFDYTMAYVSTPPAKTSHNQRPYNPHDLQMTTYDDSTVPSVTPDRISTVKSNTLTIKDADDSLTDLIVGLTQEKVNTNILLIRDCPDAASLRGLLLGRRAPRGMATWDELWVARLEHMVPYIRVKFDDCTGQLISFAYKHSEELQIEKSVALERLSRRTAILLRAWPECVEKKMLNTDGSVDLSILKQLFNLSRTRKETVLFSDVSVDYHTHTRLIDRCLLNASTALRCRVDDAKMAYDQTIRDPTGESRKWVDLRKFTKDFDTHLTERFVCNGYLDTTSVVTSRPRTQGIPKVRTYTVRNKTNLSVPEFRVWVIDDPISPSFKSRLISAMNELAFMVGDKGKERAFVRNASTCTEYPTPVVIGKKTVYAAEPLSPVEEEILSIANSIAEMQYDHVKKRCRRDYKITFHCNLIHTVVGALSDSVYAPHSDYGQLLCTADNAADYQHVESDKWLPKRDEMQVITLVISNSQKTSSTELVYTDGSSKLATIPLNSCCMHIQGPGSQCEGIKHFARVTGSNGNGGDMASSDHASFLYWTNQTA